MNNTNTLLGVLAGTAVGASLGILFAPDKGTTTRQLIADKANETTDAIGSKVLEIKEALVQHGQSRQSTLDSRLEELVADASYETEDVITSLEARLKTLKEKNKKLRSA